MDSAWLPYTPEPILEDGILIDVRLSVGGKTWHMWGRNGRAKEEALAETCPPDTLPVLLGAGLGYCLKRLAQLAPVAVVDREASILKLTEALAPEAENITWITAENPTEALRALREWRTAHDDKPIHLLRIPLYQRIAPNYYGFIAKTLEAENGTNFWQQARYPKFRRSKPRILFFKADYFLSEEIATSLKKLDIPFETLTVETGGAAAQGYVEELLKKVLAFKPDFALTINHFGLDRDGKITHLLERLDLPLASWFVDNPHLILYRYQGLEAPNVALFSYDAGNLEHLRRIGFRQVHYLPLATDPDRFKPGLAAKSDSWKAQVSFVGNSMTETVKQTLKSAVPSSLLRLRYTSIAAAFAKSEETSVADFISENYPELAEEIAEAECIEQQLALESLITWESTRQYRLQCVRGTLNFSPLIVGDEAWKHQLPDDGTWRHLSVLNYYRDLPSFYPCSVVNFNCTSLQMKGAVNQRVFDVPACGGFLLTDRREQMENLFEPGTEVAIYNDVDEIPDQIARYLDDPQKRDAIRQNARKRILTHHTYGHRLKTLCRIMRDSFS